MVGLSRYLFAAVSLAVLNACTVVTVPEPLGTPVVVSNARDWEGIWLADREGDPVFVFVESVTKGSFQLCRVSKAPAGKSPMARLDCATALLRDVGRERFVFIAIDDKGVGSLKEHGTPLQGRWLFLLFERREDRVSLWAPDGKAVEQMIKSGDMKGSVVVVKASSENGIAIEGLDERLLEEWATSKREDIFGFDWKLMYELYERSQ